MPVYRVKHGNLGHMVMWSSPSKFCYMAKLSAIFDTAEIPILTDNIVKE
jgi:hypothetical protein